MARLNEDAQWIVLMGFLVSFALIFLGIIINQSTVVGQTTAESVLEFPKNDILDARSEILFASKLTSENVTLVQKDMSSLALYRKNAIVSFSVANSTGGSPYAKTIIIHYNNGVTAYNETTDY
jgi:membrane-bound inhibitor of C-type lysozyme